jgi:NAD(P)-dependent dehydrogenase (short-subunit alcohol dehydrogenase family)
MTEGAREWEKANPGWAEKIVAETPLGRVGEVTDIATAVVWLMSENASFVSGEVLTVNGAYVTAQA